MLRKKIESGEIRVIDDIKSDSHIKYITANKYVREITHNHRILLKDVVSDSTLLVAIVTETEIEQ